MTVQQKLRHPDAIKLLNNRFIRWPVSISANNYLSRHSRRAPQFFCAPSTEPPSTLSQVDSESVRIQWYVCKQIHRTFTLFSTPLFRTAGFYCAISHFITSRLLFSKRECGTPIRECHVVSVNFNDTLKRSG